MDARQPIDHLARRSRAGTAAGQERATIGGTRQEVLPLSARTMLLPSARPMFPSRTRRPLALLALFAAAGVGAAVAHGSSTPDPTEIAQRLHADVTRDVLSRTGDFTANVGPLDCVEVKPGAGSCLANLTSAAHRADHVMIAVSYSVGADGHITWGVRLP